MIAAKGTLQIEPSEKRPLDHLSSRPVLHIEISHIMLNGSHLRHIEPNKIR